MAIVVQVKLSKRNLRRRGTQNYKMLRAVILWFGVISLLAAAGCGDTSRVAEPEGRTEAAPPAAAAPTALSPPEPTPTPTPTPSQAPVVPTETGTAVPSPTDTATAPATSTATPTVTPSAVIESPTPSPEVPPSAAAVPTATTEPTATSTPASTPAETSPTATPTQVPPTATATVTPAPSATPTASPTVTAAPTAEPTAEPTAVSPAAKGHGRRKCWRFRTWIQARRSRRTGAFAGVLPGRQECRGGLLPGFLVSLLPRSARRADGRVPGDQRPERRGSGDQRRRPERGDVESPRI